MTAWLQTAGFAIAGFFLGCTLAWIVVFYKAKGRT